MRTWNDAVVSPKAKIRDAISSLNKSSLRIVLVASDENLLLGTISDGDIRRGLLRGLSIESSIKDVVNIHPISVTRTTSRRDVEQIMSKHKIFQIPVVDEYGVISGLHSWDQMGDSTVKENLFVIMAGGRGTRLMPKTATTPKPMLELGDKPVLRHIIEHARDEGFRRFVIAIHHLGKVIEDYFGGGENLGVEINYIREATPLGTAGALSLIDYKILKEPLVVSNGDVLTGIKYSNLLDFHVSNRADATMAVQRQSWQSPFGVVETSEIEITGYEEKPKFDFLINSGVYVLDPDSIPLMPKNTWVDMPSLFSSVREKGGKTIAYMVHERWVDIGRHEDLKRATREFTKRDTLQ